MVESDIIAANRPDGWKDLGEIPRFTVTVSREDVPDAYGDVRPVSLSVLARPVGPVRTCNGFLERMRSSSSRVPEQDRLRTHTDFWTTSDPDARKHVGGRRCVFAAYPSSRVKS